MPSSRISRALQQAMNAPDGAQNLSRFIATFQRKHPQLLSVDDGRLEQRLSAFLTDYARLLPVLLVELDQACHTLRCGAASQQLLAILDQFIAAIEPARFDYGLVGVLDKLYFGHRLVEELHDQLLMHQGQPMLSWDTTLANLLIHALIGDSYATRLDLTAQEIVDHLPKIDAEAPISVSGASHWPCLIREHGLKLSLS
ncbi:hypothetical protein [Saccharospirillum mangrovi]|uniref:hypothetical protein n=1 Tax=Saccharospirillum mangrovi TaxID=2161747 RepID=UPI00130061D8|nr:hypothetical protein [Saccharospirillum mangrovi]